MHPLLAPVRTKIIVACVIQAIGSLAGLAPFVAVALIGAELLDGATVDDDRVRGLAALAVGALAVRLICLMAASAVTHLADNDLGLSIRRRIAEHLSRVPLGWFDRSSGEVKKVLIDDVTALHHLVAHSYLNLVAAVVVPVASLVYLFVSDWRFALVTMVPVVIGLFLYSRQMSGYTDKMRDYHQSLGAVNAATVEFVEGISVVKAFGQVGRAHQRFRDAAHAFADYFWNWVRSMLAVTSLSEVILSPVAVVTWIAVTGTAAVGAGWMTLSELLPFLVLGVGVTAPILSLGYAANDLQVAGEAAERIQELLDVAPLEVTEGGSEPADGRVCFEQVRFSYDGEHPALDGIDLELAPGTVTALVGPSGSGKSTLARMLPRFWDPEAGRVLLGGVDLRQMDPAVLYRHVGFVFQDVGLLHTSVRDNITLGRPDATDEQVHAAARAAQIHDRIMELPQGYHSVIGEDARLSGGEAQRVAIARALLADAPVLVLDEATAFADPESEARIQTAISHLVAGRTLLVIAHRLHTVTGADQIVVMDGGRIVERGRHEELLDRCGRYAQLWNAQRRDDDPMPTLEAHS